MTFSVVNVSKMYACEAHDTKFVSFELLLSFPDKIENLTHSKEKNFNRLALFGIGMNSVIKTHRTVCHPLESNLSCCPLNREETDAAFLTKLLEWSKLHDYPIHTEAKPSWSAVLLKHDFPISIPSDLWHVIASYCPFYLEDYLYFLLIQSVEIQLFIPWLLKNRRMTGNGMITLILRNSIDNNNNIHTVFLHDLRNRIFLSLDSSNVLEQLCNVNSTQLDHCFYLDYAEDGWHRFYGQKGTHKHIIEPYERQRCILAVFNHLYIAMDREFQCLT